MTQIPEMAMVLIAVARVPSTNPTAISPHFPGCFTISYLKKKAQMPHKYIKYQVLEWKKKP